MFGIYRKKANFLFILYFYRLHAMSHQLKEGAENEKNAILANPFNFGAKIFITF